MRLILLADERNQLFTTWQRVYPQGIKLLIDNITMSRLGLYDPNSNLQKTQIAGMILSDQAIEFRKL